MFRCKDRCEREKLYTAFLQQKIQASNQALAAEALAQLQEYAACGDRKLCSLGADGMRECVIRIRSLESQGVSPDTTYQWISIIGQFYDFLIREGCTEENPIQILKAQEIERLLKRMEKQGYKRQKLGGGDEKERR